VNLEGKVKNRDHHDNLASKNRARTRVGIGLLKKCSKCGEYTLNEVACPKCGGAVYTPRPPKFSPDDRYAKYRRALKEEARKN